MLERCQGRAAGPQALELGQDTDSDLANNQLFERRNFNYMLEQCPDRHVGFQTWYAGVLAAGILARSPCGSLWTQRAILQIIRV